MNLQIEIIKGKMVTPDDLAKFRHDIRFFCEKHKVVSVSTAISSTIAGGSDIVATFPYEGTDNNNE